MLSSVVAYGLSWFVLFLWVFLIVLGIIGWRTGRWPGRQRQTIKFGQHEVSITDLAVALVVVGVIGTTVSAAMVPTDLPHLPPDRIDAQQVPAKPQTAQGPWSSKGNDVVLTVSSVTYANHHARIDLRVDNDAGRRSIEGQDYYLTVVDNTGKSRDVDFDSSSFYRHLVLGPGQVASGVVQVGESWSNVSEYFDVRINVSGDGRYWTVATPGIPVPPQERVAN